MRTAATLLAFIAGIAGAAGAGAQELGRLFFTPEQRAALDARRKARVPDKPAATPQAESPITRVQGAVQRSGGRSTVWVNGEAIPEGSPGGAQPASPGRVTLPAGEGSQRYDLRVGESLDRGSGEVKDVIGEGEIRINSRPASKKK
jgi:hypothetical protein